MTEQPAADDAAVFLRVAFQVCPTVGFITTTGGVIVHATNAAATFLNVAIEALKGRPLLHFVARGDTRRFRAFVNGGARGVMSVRLRPRHGTPLAVSMAIHHVPGRMIWFVDPSVASEQPSVAQLPAAVDRPAVSLSLTPA